MKKPFIFSHSFIFIFLIILLVSISIALIQLNKPPQDSPPTETLELEVGSTDGITVFAFVIAGSILIPLITSGALSRKKTPPQE